MEIYLVDGTYELFRHYFALPSRRNSDGQETAAVRGVLASILSLLELGHSYIAVATDHVIESFRNDLYANYKTSAGLPADLLSQFPLLEEGLEAMGVVVFPMIEFEADDALASAAAKAASDERTQRVIICTPDKDLSQCVYKERVVQLDRRRQILYDEQAVVTKFGVSPASIPDYLALVGDTSDGYPGIPKWGAKAASSVLSVYHQLENIPEQFTAWPAEIKNARNLADMLECYRSDAYLFRTLATLRLDVPVFDNIDDLRWRGYTDAFSRMCSYLGADNLKRKADTLLSSVDFSR